MTQMCQRAEQRAQKHADIEKEEEDLSNSQQNVRAINLQAAAQETGTRR